MSTYKIKNFSIGALWGSLFALLFSFLVAKLAHADSAAAASLLAPPDWLAGVLGSVLGMFPKVGSVVILVVKWLGFISGALTALAVFLKALSEIGQGLFNVAGFSKVAQTIDDVENVILPWVKFLSMFNQRTPLPGINGTPLKPVDPSTSAGPNQGSS